MTDKPLLLRRRRDGVLVADGPLPERFEFQHSWLLGNGASIARIEGGQVVLSLANVRAWYAIEKRTDSTIVGVLQTSDELEVAPVDEERAAELEAERRERVIGEIVAKYGVDTVTAESIAEDTGQLPAAGTGSPAMPPDGDER